VPVPDAGVPKEWVLGAREAIQGNAWSSNAGDRVWNLTGGVIRCAECGRAMSVNYMSREGPRLLPLHGALQRRFGEPLLYEPHRPGRRGR
jgi:hypothetical protein